MKKHLSGGQLAGGNTATKREENDFWATNPKTTRMFLEKFKLEGSILEPSCGQGHLAEVIKEFYPNNEIVSTDLIDRGYGQGGIDFLKHDYGRNFDTVITNPPFKFAQEFIEKGLEISNRYVIMFCKIQLLEGVSRRKLFDNSPLKYIYVHSQRQSTWKDGRELDANGKKWSTVMCLAWFVWDKEYDGEPIVRWI